MAWSHARAEWCPGAGLRGTGSYCCIDMNGVSSVIARPGKRFLVLREDLLHFDREHLGDEPA